MKTPKRKYSFPIDSFNYPGMRNAFEGEDVPSAHARQCERWKRKNREAQYKRTIAGLTKENYYLKKLLAIRIWEDVLRAERETLVFAQEHLSIDRRPPEIKQEDGKYLYVIKRPIVKWDGKPITP